MKTAKALQDIFTKVAQDFELDLSGTPQSYRFVDKNSDTITVTIENDAYLRIGEYKDFGDGKLTGDPEFVIFTGEKEWLPVGFSERGSGRVWGDMTTPDGKQREFVASPVQEKIAQACEEWLSDLMKRNEYDGETGFLIPTWLA